MVRVINIQVSELVWKELMSQKNIGETFDIVLRRLLKIEDKHQDT